MSLLMHKKKSRKALDNVDKRTVAAIAPRLVVDQWDHLIINNDFVRMLMVTDWPNYMVINWAEIFTMIGDVCAPVSLVNKKIPDLKAFINYTANDTKWDFNRSHETMVDRKQREYEAEQAEDAAMMISRMNTHILETYLYIKVIGQDKETLEKNTDLVMNRLNSYGITAEHLSANQMQMFWAGSPFMLENEIVERRYNYAAPSLSIARGLWNRDIGVCDNVGIPLGHDDMGGICRLNTLKNTFTRPNGNILIGGESGSGKSTLLKVLIIYLYLMFDCRIIINDLEGEFVQLTKAMGGKVSSMNASSAMLISPFEPRNFGASSSVGDDNFDFFNEDEEVTQARQQAMYSRVLATHLPFVTQFLLKAFSLPQNFKNIIYTACYIAYEKYGITKETTFAEYTKRQLKFPCLQDVYDALAAVEKTGRFDISDIKNIQNSLLKAVNGPEEYLWTNSESKLKDSSLMCIDMQGLSADPNMQEAQYYNLLTWEWTQITTNRYSDKKTIIITDELQKSFTKTNSAFCEKYADMVRRARKYGAVMISALQDPAAFSVDEIKDYGRTINSNSAYKLFGTTTETDNVNTVKKLLNATDDTMIGLAKTSRGRFLLKIGTERQCWVNVEADQWMFDIFGKGGGE